MRLFALSDEGARVSELVFGAASIGGRVPPWVGLRALDLALELGVTTVDLARSYGFGAAERIVGRALRAKRSRVVLVSKGGLAPASIGWAPRLGAWLGYPLLRHRRSLARRVSSGAIDAAKALPLLPSELLASLHQSLSELGTDHLDVFLTHRCPSTPSEYDAIAAALSREVERGSVRAWGICGEASELRRVSGHAPPPVVQTSVNVLEPIDTSDLATKLVMCFQPFGGGWVAERLGRAAPGDVRGSDRTAWVAELALRGLVSTPTTPPRVLVCSMSSTAHVRTNVRALAAPRLSESTLRSAMEIASRAP